MASYHHHHHHHQPYHATSVTGTTTTTCSCRCPCANFPPCHHPPPPDHLLHHTPPPQIHPFHPPNPQPHNPNHFQEIPHHHNQQQSREQHLQPIISSLLRRISALESSLINYSMSASYSLRDAAARTIQTQFRSFILRRSRTLGQLKNLASIKSTLNSLKLSLSENSYIDCQLLYAKSTNLLLRLDSIQGLDPMIRDGKMSIRRELNQFFKLIDGVYLKKSELSSRIVKNVRGGGYNSKPRVVYSDRRGNFNNVNIGRRKDGAMNVREQIRRVGEMDIVGESDGEEYEDLGNIRALLVRNKGGSVIRNGGIKLHENSQAKVKRSVRFADNEVIRSRNEPALIGEHDSDDDGDLSDADQLLMVDDLLRETRENGILTMEKVDDEEEGQTEEDEGSPPSSNGGSDVTFSSRSRSEAGRTSYDQSEDGSFTFCAPLPVKMEPRADLMSRTKLVK